MIFVLLYVIASSAIFVWVLNGARFKRLHSKVINRHPEMREVRRTDPLLVVKFDADSSLGAHSDEQPSDLGFAEFLADHGPNHGNHDRQ